MNKYGNRKIKYDGMTFDSKKEYLRFMELSLLQKAGKIRCLERQTPFELIPAQRDRETNKIVERACNYKADFTYYDENGKYIVEDAKGFRTKDFIIKRKLMLWVFGIKIKET